MVDVMAKGSDGLWPGNEPVTVSDVAGSASASAALASGPMASGVTASGVTLTAFGVVVGFGVDRLTSGV